MDKEPINRTGWSFTLEDGWTPPHHPLDDIEENIEDDRDIDVDVTRPSPINPFVSMR